MLVTRISVCDFQSAQEAAHREVHQMIVGENLFLPRVVII